MRRLRLALCGSMALSELERKRVERVLAPFMQKRRPPAHIRSELDLGYRISGQSVEIFEVRPHWSDSSQKLEHSVAKATYVRSRSIWRVYWLRADLKWHLYEPAPAVGALEAFLTLVDEDEHSCFF